MLTTLLTIAALYWLVFVAPGVNMLLISQLAASGQRGAASFAALGVACSALTWSVLAIFGVGTVFTVFPSVRQAIQLAGAVYLLYFAVRLWRGSAGMTVSSHQYLAPIAAFRTGFVTNITNPKATLFFGSVFATVLPGSPSSQMMALVVCLVVISSFCWHMILAMAFSHSRVQTAYSRQSKFLSRLAGALMGVFGVRLLVATVEEVRIR